MSASAPVEELVVAGFIGKDIDDPGPRALLDLGLSRFVLFGRNVVDPKQVAALLFGLASRAPCPALLCVDQEGGRVARLRAPLTVWPPMATVGGADDPALTEAVGAALGEEIGALGFNVDFAPVADVNSHALNPVIGDRAFGTELGTVERAVPAFLRGLQRAGVAGCAKHFPGHGHVDKDSHLELPTCSLSAEDLRSAHLPAFAAAIAAEAASVMTAHVLYPAVDPQHPATLSATWIEDMLRSQMGWRGVVFTDDLEMGALSGGEGIGAAAIAAVRAGCDGLLVCKDLDKVRTVLDALRREASADPRFAERCRVSAARLRRLAERFPARTVPVLPDGWARARPESERLADRLRDAAAVGVDPTEGGVG